MPVQKPGRSRQDYETPEEFLQAVKGKFGIQDFDWDLAASPENAKADQFVDEEMNSLLLLWRDLPGRNFWLNPPFKDIASWVEKAAATEWSNTRRLFMLLPASVGSCWYASYVEHGALVLALRPRLTFAGANDPYPKDLILVVYGEWPGFHTWDWKNG